MIVYTSRTGNVKNIISKLNISSIEIKEGLIVNEPYFLFTYTDGLGNTPSIVESFLNSNYKYLRGVIASGNLNFGQYYCQTAEKISEKYDVPIIRKIDLRGQNEDLKIIEEQYKKHIEVNSHK